MTKIRTKLAQIGKRLSVIDPLNKGTAPVGVPGYFFGDGFYGTRYFGNRFFR